MTSIKPHSAFLNALAGPSRAPYRPSADTTLRARLPLRPAMTQLRAIHPRSPLGSNGGTEDVRPVSYGTGSREYGQASTPLHRHARRFTSSSSAPADPSSSSPYQPLLATAPIAAVIPSDPIDPSTPTSMLDPLVALLLSSPLPAGLTILILTFTFRSAVTLPATIWQRRRMKRTKEIVRPAMKALNEQLAGVVAKECRAKGIDYEGYKKELKSQLATHQSALHKQHGTHPLPTMLLPLFVHVPLIITLSLTIRRTIEAPFSPWAAESWWWLQHLGEVDPTMILPIAGGIVGMMNAEVIGRRNKDLGEAVEVTVPTAPGETVEGRAAVLAKEGISPIAVARSPTPSSSSSPTRSATSRPPTLPSHLVKFPQAPSRQLSTTTLILSASAPTRSDRKPRQATPPTRPATPSRRSSPSGPRQPTSPQSHLQPISPVAEQSKELDKSRLTSKLFTNAMRVGAVLFIPIAAQVPAALALYWTGSMVFTLVQNLTLDWLDTKEKKTPGETSI